MPITLRHLTADSTWLITLTSPQSPPTHKPYIILVDPWIEGPSPVWHPKFALNHHTVPSSISNLSELSQQPDLLLISQTKTDHCNELTCRQLPKSGVQVYAVPGADSIVRGWKHFDAANVHRLRPFTSRKTGRVSRIPIYRDGRPSTPPNQAGEVAIGTSDAISIDDGADGAYTFEKDPNIAAIVELAFMPALKPWEIPSIHIALGISYTPTQDPITNVNNSSTAAAMLPPSPPPQLPSAPHLLHPHPGPHPGTQVALTAHTATSTSTLSSVPSHTSGSSSSSAPPPHTPSTVVSNSASPPTTAPSSKPSTASTKPSSSLPSTSSPNKFPRRPSELERRRNPQSANLKLPGRKSTTRTESILYTPHGVPASAITAYLASLPLPLTALLHCFVRVDNPRWLGGTVSSGAPNAFRIVEETKRVRGEQARRAEEPISPMSDCTVEHPLGVKYLVATHDEEVQMQGFCSHFVRKRRWQVGEIEKEVRRIAGDDGQDKVEEGADVDADEKVWVAPTGLKLLDLAVGEEAALV
ncbi:hypothetical protein Dda_8156 [Drechslerella dactyloides]|uniref:Uncharacterized protein n=1 Tax=Drechslerella dactyloides TaxID=74499 RepID=A0AAD6IRW1_DREDA|nr:hypothetical protein Dda_8156 [Drechslerella dactyloides]